jgi:uroporphyrinogen-III synthase
MTARLAGRKLLLTRSVEDSSEWSTALAAEGAEPSLLPCIETEICNTPDLGTRLATAAADADWIVFTSRRGVDAFARLMPNDVSLSAKLAAVGESTAARVVEQLGHIDLVGPRTATELAAQLAGVVGRGDSVVLALAANAGDVLGRRLAEAGVEVVRLDVYRTIPKRRIEPKRALSTLGCDTVIFASPTAVTGFDNQISVDIERQFVTIGPTTSAAVRELSWPVAAEAKEPNLNGIIESILETGHV